MKLSIIPILLALWPAAAQSQQELVLVGSGYKNISACRFNLMDGTLTPMGIAAQIDHPSYISISPNHRFLYSITEGQSKASSSISAYAIDLAAGKLTFLNRQPVGGSGPCYVEIDPRGKNALVANYGSGSFAVLPLADDGKVQPMSAFIQDKGSSVDRERQEGPHAHCLVAGPGDKFVYGCDLGLDKVMIFKFDPDHGKLTAADPAFARTKAGAGPRHIAFHPNGRWAYLISEMGSTISALAVDSSKGTLKTIQTESIKPADYSGAVQNTGAEVAVHPSGKFVYGSNRGDNSIAVFGCDPETGRLTFIERVPTGGKTPRQFEIDPTGRYLLAANQDSDTVVVFRIDADTGRLQPTGNQVTSRRPMCVRFLTEP